MSSSVYRTGQRSWPHEYVGYDSNNGADLFDSISASSGVRKLAQATGIQYRALAQPGSQA